MSLRIQSTTGPIAPGILLSGITTPRECSLPMPNIETDQAVWEYMVTQKLIGGWTGAQAMMSVTLQDSGLYAIETTFWALGTTDDVPTFSMTVFDALTGPGGRIIAQYGGKNMVIQDQFLYQFKSDPNLTSLVARVGSTLAEVAGTFVGSLRAKWISR